MSVVVDSKKVLQVLDWAYEKSLNGMPGSLSAGELGEEYLRKNNGDVIKACADLINWQVAKCTTSGFITGVGGVLTLPVAIPTNIVCVIYVQMRMIAAIAYLGGHNIKDDSVKSIVYMCLTGNAVGEIAKEIGIKIGGKLTQSTIQKISRTTLMKINQTVQFRLITKFGQTGVLNLGKAIPIVGAIIGGGVDLLTTNAIGEISKKVFLT